MSDLSQAVERHLQAASEKERQARQERHQEAQERAEATDARERRWEALGDRERLRLGIVAHHRGMDPRDLMDTNTNKENSDA